MRFCWTHPANRDEGWIPFIAALIDGLARRYINLYPSDKRPQRPPSRLLIGHSPFPEESCL